MNTSDTLTRDLVMVGGGHAHALVLRKWGMAPLIGARVTLIDPSPVAPYTGMLPGFVAGHYQLPELEIDLHRLCTFAKVRFVLGSVEKIDTASRSVILQDGQDIGYDVLSINVGINTQMPELLGFEQHGAPVKPMAAFAARWSAFLEQLSENKVQPAASVIGGGVGGCELALAMMHAMRAVTDAPQVTLIESRSEVAHGAGAAQGRLMTALIRSGVNVITDAEVVNIESNKVGLKGRLPISSDFTVGAAGARAHAWVRGAGMPVTEDGFLRVDADLRVLGEDMVFATGDCAHLEHAPRPKAGVFAVRAAPVLHDNLRATLTGQPLRKFQPQSSYLKLISTGPKSAIANKWGRAVQGRSLWRLKDKIDRDFIRKLTDLPKMSVPESSDLRALGADRNESPLCAGCGGKAAPNALFNSLEALGQAQRPDILLGAGDDAAVLKIGGAKVVWTTDHLRAFTLDHLLMTRVTILHALGDIWAMGAKPHAALLNVTLPRMSEALQTRTLKEILTEAERTLQEAGAVIVGGHSSLGAELSIGLTASGLLNEPPITVSGAQAGDVIVLSRPLGTGIILAADMQGLVSGRDMSALFSLLKTTQQDAAQILSDAHALTDVTGFGLAGHLMSLCNASRVGAALTLEDLPILPNAEELAAKGVRSTIWQSNRDAVLLNGKVPPLADILFDPQTAGGFLAAIPEANALRVIKDLRLAGHKASAIGRFVDGPPSISLS